MGCFDLAEEFALTDESCSWKYVDLSIRNGRLENIEDHRVGPTESTVREAGSIDKSAKRTRIKFTTEDDRYLNEFVHQHGDIHSENGAALYKTLEREVRPSVFVCR